MLFCKSRGKIQTRVQQAAFEGSFQRREELLALVGPLQTELQILDGSFGFWKIWNHKQSWLRSFIPDCKSNRSSRGAAVWHLKRNYKMFDKNWTGSEEVLVPEVSPLMMLKSSSILMLT